MFHLRLKSYYIYNIFFGRSYRVFPEGKVLVIDKICQNKLNSIKNQFFLRSLQKQRHLIPIQDPNPMQRAQYGSSKHKRPKSQKTEKLKRPKNKTENFKNKSLIIIKTQKVEFLALQKPLIALKQPIFGYIFELSNNSVFRSKVLSNNDTLRSKNGLVVGKILKFYIKLDFSVREYHRVLLRVKY